MTLGTILIIAGVAAWTLWVMFVAVMHLRDVRNRWGLTTPQKVMGLPLLAIGYTLDVALRLTVFSALFLRPPALECRERVAGTGGIP